MKTKFSTRGRTFGIEFEMTGLSQSQAYSVLCAAHVPCEDGGYRHTDRDDLIWDVKSDSSINSERSCEIASPILEWGNTDHYNLVRSVLGSLRSAGAGVNVSCGTHVHIGIDDIDRHFLVRLMQIYSTVQNSIDQNVSPSRRNSQWARYVPSWHDHGNFPLWDRSSGHLSRWANHDERYKLSRYMTVNLHAVTSHSTVEFRQRNATLNARKALEWTGLMMGLLSRTARTSTDEAYEMPYRTTLPAERQAVWEWLRDDLDPEAAIFSYVKGGV